MQLQKFSYDVIVIGGGASGMMAAFQAAGGRKRVLLLEKNAHLGKKLAITGGGRCNITNDEPDIRTFLQNFGTSAPFLYSPFSQFGVADTMQFFTHHGLSLVTQGLGRVFPVSERSADVVSLFNRLLRERRVEIQTNCTVIRLVESDGSISQVETSLGIYEGNSIILATGGISHPETGSTGDGFSWLSKLGHRVTKPTLTIVPIAVKESWVKKNAGKKLEQIKLTVYHEEKKQFSKIGNVLLTHFGLSGPMVLNSAGVIQPLLETGKVTGSIDLYPKEDEGALSKRVLEYFSTNSNKQLKTVLKDITQPGIGKAIEILLPGINQTTPVHSITKVERKSLIKLLKSLPLTITKLMGEDRAVAADGGVALSEIDMRTMQSKKIINLFVTGDLLNINRPSGGYSLQLCWTTGYIAGMHA